VDLAGAYWITWEIDLIEEIWFSEEDYWRRIENVLTIIKMSMLDSFNEFLIEARLSGDGREDNEDAFKQCVYITRGMQL
jgi:hypothetical protein